MVTPYPVSPLINCLLARIERCDLLKIDAEGAEIAIIEGADRCIWPRISNVAIEYHDYIHPESGERLKSYIAGLGFTAHIKTNFSDRGLIYARRN